MIGGKSYLIGSLTKKSKSFQPNNKICPGLEMDFADINQITKF